MNECCRYFISLMGKVEAEINYSYHKNAILVKIRDTEVI